MLKTLFFRPPFRNPEKGTKYLEEKGMKRRPKRHDKAA